MKFKIIPVIFAVMLCLSAGTLVNAQSGAVAAPAAGAQDPAQGAPRHRGFRREGMKLTDAQKAQLKTIRQGVHSQVQALRNDKSLAREDLRSKIQAIRQGTRQQFMAVLTPEQQQAMKGRLNGREGRQGELGRRGPGGGGPLGRGPGGRGGFAALGLSDDQQAKLKAIHQGTRSQIEAVRNDSSLSREQRQAKIKSIFDSTKQQTMGILTPEQQQKLKEGRRGGPGRFGPRGRRGGGDPDNAPPNKP